MTQSGRCHSFDVRADGYAKSEGVNCVMLKNLDSAIRDGDPIRAVIRGWATNSDGYTPGITHPSVDAQVACIKRAYAKAGIEDYSQTGYLECHGTGTPIGDAVETTAIANVFAQSRDDSRPLIIGSVKSNIGHSEAASGLSGLIKSVMAIENGVIPGTPSFITPNPNINFQALRLHVSQTSIPWPLNTIRRASINSFGYGGTNCHLIVEDARLHLGVEQNETYNSSLCSSTSLSLDEDDPRDVVYPRPYIIVLSAVDDDSLTINCKKLLRHLADLHVHLKLPDLSYTLATRRSHHSKRAFAVSNSLNLHARDFMRGQKQFENPRIGFIFTGQGSQWPQMGKDLVRTFPRALEIISEMDAVLQGLPDAPTWSLLDMLVEPHDASRIRQPEISQPLVTAIQLTLVALLEDWNIFPDNVIGHSSGEIAAAYAAGYISKEDAIINAFYRGHAAKVASDSNLSVGMMAVGLGKDEIRPHLEDLADSVYVACVNSPRSITLSGVKTSLEMLRDRLSSVGIFVRILQVDLAYHSPFMKTIGDRYEHSLGQNLPVVGEQPSNTRHTSMFSTVTGEVIKNNPDSQYWRKNMCSPVQFWQGLAAMLSDSEPDLLVEIGPSNTLAGPVRQTNDNLANSSKVEYFSALKRGEDPIGALFDLCGQLYLRGCPIKLERVNRGYEQTNTPPAIVDLPNYGWNHSFSYWNENESSKDWRFRRYLPHDLLGSKILGTTWHTPSWKNTLRLRSLPWLEDHKIGSDVIFPAAGYISMAIEALYQATCAVNEQHAGFSISQLHFSLRNVEFKRAMILDHTSDTRLVLTLESQKGINSWRLFRISSFDGKQWTEHCTGLIRTSEEDSLVQKDLVMPKMIHATPAQVWYRKFADIGYGYGPSFEKMLLVEARVGAAQNRCVISMQAPAAAQSPSFYPIHPTCLDACLQSVFPSLWQGDHTAISTLLLPARIDSLVIHPQPNSINSNVASAKSTYSGRGRLQDRTSWSSDCSLNREEDGKCVLRINGLRFSSVDLGSVQPAAQFWYRSVWCPDITKWSFMPQKHWIPRPNTVNELINWVVHKHGEVSIIELNWDSDDASSLWLDRADHPMRDLTKKYRLLLSDHESLVKSQNLFPNHASSMQMILDRDDPLSGPEWPKMQLVILKSSDCSVHDSSMGRLLGQISEIMSTDGMLVIVAQSLGSDSHSNDARSDSSVFMEHEDRSKSYVPFSHLLSLDLPSSAKHVQLYSRASPAPSCPPQPVALYSFQKTSPISKGLRESLTQNNISLSEVSIHGPETVEIGIGLVVDEIYAPLLCNISSQQWESLKTLFERETPVLWVTQGAQHQVTNPDSSLIYGYLRSLRAEGNASSRFVILDVENGDSPGSRTAITTLLSEMSSSPDRFDHEWEFCERSGIIHVNRIYQDRKLNNLDDIEPAQTSIASCDEKVALHATHLGSLEALQWTQEDTEDSILAPGDVEVKIDVAGLNFKDVALAMGIVHGDEYRLGHEGSGRIQRVGSQTAGYQVGDRVAVFSIGSFANRIQVSTELIHHIPDNMSFEDAATLPLVYSTALYSLLDVANLQANQSVLIHSATGGLGIACIQIAQYIGAKVYATAGTQEKRELLCKEYSIPESQVFSSRDTRFVAGIRGATQGGGVDVIVNTLTGDLLHESWMLCADGGIFVELGKKDIIERNSLSMEPFDRNCSFRAVDLSHKQITDTMKKGLLTRIFDMIKCGNIGPIRPQTTFALNDIQSAFAHMRSARHIGKILILAKDDADTSVPVHSSRRPISIPGDRTYLIVGGLRGLCGSLAICLAQRGAKHITIISRSGCNDERSKAIIADCENLGCRIVDAVGDVTSLQHVKNVFQKADPPIRGVIHGAMVLRDKPIETMSAVDFHQTISSKVKGAWNIHHAAAEQDKSQSLEFFTMLSSISGVVGQKGQANYAAANVFLDSFAAYRCSLGLPAHSLDLGVVDAIGVAAEKGGMERYFNLEHWPRIKESKLHEILCISIDEQKKARYSQLITGLPSGISQLPILSQDARFSILCAEDSQTEGHQPVSPSKDTSSKELYEFRLLVKAMKAKSQLVEKAVTLCGLQLSRLLYLKNQVIDANKSLAAYGLDSLIAIEFRNWLKKELAVEMSTFEVIGASCLHALAEKMVSKVEAGVPVVEVV
ncbi:Highly reducing polyketide synthase ClaI [Penicillium crustosum]